MYWENSVDQKALISRHIGLMKTSCETLGHILAPVSQETATTYRDLNDGDKGWTVLEVVCHLRDFDVIFRDRVNMMRNLENPALPAWDHEALAVERSYNEKNLVEAYSALATSRRQFVVLLEDLGDAEWRRTGNHPERAHFTMLDALMQVGLHDVMHLEQITRILRGV